MNLKFARIGLMTGIWLVCLSCLTDVKRPPKTDLQELIEPQTVGRQANIKVVVKDDGDFYIADVIVLREELETHLQSILKNEKEPTIVLSAEETVPVKDMIFVMDIANKNNYKVVLAVKPN